jgi:hypothetical protein
VVDPLLRTKRGYYAGTRVNGSWWRRYRKWGWLTRGNAEIWVAPSGLRFRLFLTDTVRHIPPRAISDVAVEEGRWHAATYTGTPALRLSWRDGEDRLVTWLCVSRDVAETGAWAAALERIGAGRCAG